MKRGRPSTRSEVQREIVETLSAANIPITISSIAKEVSRKLGRQISWNTIQKYTNELIALDRVSPIHLPHSKKPNESGLVVYTLKK